MVAGQQFKVMVESKYIISSKRTLLDALVQISDIKKGPLVLFVVDENNRMVGTLTDGDSRRALIAGVSVNDKAEKVMHRNFNFIRVNDIFNVQEIRRQKEMLMKLVPVLDEQNHIVDVINLDKFKTRLPVDAVLMAGGKGERLRPLTEKTPKPLLPVGGKAIIDHNIDRLITYGVQHISVTVNYLKEQIEDHFAQPHNDVLIHTVCEPKYLGTIGSIKFVKEFFNDTVLVMNSDIFTNINYEEFFIHFKENDADMSVAAVPYTVSVPYGIFDLKGREIQGLIEKPTYNYYANAGIYLIKKDVLKEIPDDVFYNATDLIEKLISNGKKVIRFPLNGTWIDIGTPREYQKANDLVAHMHD
jgi:dTDP-glucose pyrophosphorylase